MITWDDWAAKSDTTKVLLIETAAVRLADGLKVQLYLSNHPYQSPDKQFLSCIAGLPRLTRQANDTLSPNHIPTWGELEILLEPDCRPDAGCSVPWTELLSEAWNLPGQPLIIKLGDPNWGYGAFRTIFRGGVGAYNWTDAKLTLTIYDKGQDLTWKLPDFELPESPRVEEGSWDQMVPAVLGKVKNYKSPMITSAYPTGPYPWKFALACHVLQAVDAVYVNNTEVYDPASYIWVQKDLFPARKDGEGAAVMDNYGPYAGPLNRAEWLVEIDSITALNEMGQSGPSVGLATFRWSLDKGVTWQGQGLLTWKLVLDPATIAHPVAVGWGAMTLAGTYTGTVKYPYKLQISTGGYVGRDAKFQFSRNNGVSYSAEIPIPGTAPIPFDQGLTAAFTGVAGSLSATTKIPAAASPGTATFGGSYDASSYRKYRAVILNPGDVGAATFKWSDDGGATWVTEHPDHSPYLTGVNIALSHGLTISFYGDPTDPPPDPPVNDFDAGDEWWCFVPALIAGDCWTWAFKEIPIPLADGVAVQFLSKAEAQAQGIDPRFLTADDDFALWDEWRFILGSSLLIGSYGEGGVNITVDAQGLISPALDAYTDKIGELIRALPLLWRNWDAVADFDLEALTAFNAAIPYQAGLVVDSTTEIAAIIDQLLTGIPALYTINQKGQFFITALTPVTTAPDGALELTDAEFLDLPEVADGSDNLYRRVYLHYDRNPNAEKNPQNSPSQPRLAWLQQEFRQVSARDETLWQNYPWAADLGPLDTVLMQRADAQAVAAMNLALYRVKHPPYKVKTKIQPFSLDLWKMIWLRHARFGVARRAFAIIGVELDFTAAEATLTLWR